MSTQPNALLLAVNLHCGDDKCKCTLNQAAEELLAQHELIQKLTAALKECVEDSEAAIVEHIQKYGQQYKAQRVAAMRKQVADARAALAAAEAHK